jgi:hypothetical protein
MTQRSRQHLCAVSARIGLYKVRRGQPIAERVGARPLVFRVLPRVPSVRRVQLRRFPLLRAAELLAKLNHFDNLRKLTPTLAHTDSRMNGW